MDHQLAKQFIQFRKKHIGTQKEAAGICECSQKHISEIESGKTGIGFDIVRHLYWKKNLNMDWWMTQIGSMIRTEKPKENLISNVQELRGEIEVMSAVIKNMQKTINTLVKDFYSEKHGVKS